MILELLLDALLDSVKMLPFLFAGVLAEWILGAPPLGGHRKSTGGRRALWLCAGRRTGPAAPVRVFGHGGKPVRQQGGHAGYPAGGICFATSDEAVPLLIANPDTGGRWR
ncbi:MAG: hypothetical protein V8T36_07170 [Ruthenibacterium lactatiformans]